MALVELEIATGLAIVTVNDPKRRNAISVDMAAMLEDVCEQVDSDSSVGALLLRGAGGYFCSGGVVDELAAISAAPLSDDGRQMLSAVYASFLRVGRLTVPSAAAVRGGAIGAGLNLAMAVDLRLVADDVRIGSGFPRIGIHAGGGHYSLLGRFMGYQGAAALGLFGATLDGPAAVDRGLAWAAYPDDEVEARATDLLRYAAADPDLARATKRSLRIELGPPALPWEAAVEVERSPQQWSFARKGADGWKR